MKIQSYEMQMQSQHSFSMEYEKKVSFESMLQLPEQTKVDFNPNPKYDANRNISDMLRTIDQIIQNLMGMLEQKVQKAKEAQEIPVISLYTAPRK